MNTEEKNRIVGYLSGPRDYAEGVAIYQRLGVNLRLKRQFALEDTSVTREILFDELRKMAGLSEPEFRNLPRLAAVVPAPVPESRVFPADVVGSGDEPEAARSEYAEAPETVRRMTRFRDRFPFLNSPDCPDVLKILVADMFTAYANYKAAHARLQALGDEDSVTAAADCETVVTEYLKNREIWEELEYYRENGAILGKAAKFRDMEAVQDLARLTDVDLMRQLNSASANESKHRKAVAVARETGEPDEKAEAAFERWSARKLALKAELDRRKKK